MNAIGLQGTENVRRPLSNVKRLAGKLFATFFVIACTVVAAADAQETPLVLDPAATQVDLSKATYLLEDPQGTLTIDDVRKPENASRFQPGSPSIGMVTSAYWLRFTLRNGASEPLPRWFDTGNRILQEITLYWPDAHGVMQRMDAGSNQRFAERPLATTTFVFPVMLAPGVATDVYLRVRTTGMLGVVVAPKLWTALGYREAEKQEHVVWFYCLGLITALAMINLLLYFYNRDRNNLFYVGSLLGVAFGLCTTMGGYGAVFELVWPNSPVFNQVSWILGIAASAILPTIFILQLINLGETRPGYARFSNFTVLLYALANVTLCFVMAMQFTGSVGWSQLLIQVSVFPYALMQLNSVVAVVTEVRRGNRSARFVAVAFTPLLVLTTIISIESVTAGAISWTPILWCAVFEWMVTAVAVADRYYQLRLERAQAREALVEGLQKSERELEGKVAQRTRELAASEARAKDLLHNMLPRSVADELSATGSTQPVRHESATVLFTDFSGFTQTASTMPPDRMVAELNAIFAAFDAITEECGVEKIKTIGDAYMAAAGVPMPCTDHAKRCVRAGLRMVQFLKERNRSAAFKWHLRVGIHTGPVVAGVVGTRRYAFDIWGDTVNMASRMESSGAVGKVNVSAYTYDLIREEFDCEYRGRVDAKGKGEVDMYFVEAV